MVQASFNVTYEGLDFSDPRVAEALLALRAQTIHAARFDLRTLLRRRIRQEIDATTTRHTGRLRRVRVRIRRKGGPGNYDLVPDFPHTAFKLQEGYGRHGGRGVGQYAFVVAANQRRQGREDFITVAIDQMILDPEFRAIVQRHFVRQLQQLLATYGR